MAMMRYGIVRGARSEKEAAAYLPSNYSVLATLIQRDEEFSAVHPDGVRARGESLIVVIGGRDEAGWGLDFYVRPRLASGLMGCDEIDLSHPVMKVVPA